MSQMPPTSHESQSRLFVTMASFIHDEKLRRRKAYGESPKIASSVPLEETLPEWLEPSVFAAPGKATVIRGPFGVGKSSLMFQLVRIAQSAGVGDASTVDLQYAGNFGRFLADRRRRPEGFCWTESGGYASAEMHLAHIIGVDSDSLSRSVISQLRAIDGSKPILATEPECTLESAVEIADTWYEITPGQHVDDHVISARKVLGRPMRGAELSVVFDVESMEFRVVRLGA